MHVFARQMQTCRYRKQSSSYQKGGRKAWDKLRMRFKRYKVLCIQQARNKGRLWESQFLTTTTKYTERNKRMKHFSSVGCCISDMKEQKYEKNLNLGYINIMKLMHQPALETPSF